MTSKVKKYGIKVSNELIITYALSSLSAMEYFYSQGYNVTLSDIIIL